MPVRLIAIDMDDTLVDDSGLPGPEASAAIAEARSAGLKVIIATGRMFSSAAPCARALGLDLPLITYNGALVKSGISGEVLSHTPVPLEVCLDVVAYCRTRQLTLNVYVDDCLIVASRNDEVRYYEDLAGLSANVVGDLEAYLLGLQAERGGTFGGSTKLLIVSTPAVVTRCVDELSGMYRGRLRAARSKPKFAEMMHPDVSKAGALKALAEGWGIGRVEVMAIGDSFNDLEMIQYAGVGVAVANAAEEVRLAADVVTMCPGGLGVAEAIRSIALRA